MAKVKRLLKSIWRVLIGKRPAETLIGYLSRLADVNLLALAYRQIGINKFQNSQISGERYVIQRILPLLMGRQPPVLFDVGANVGNSTAELRSCFPDAEIYSFEPNEHSFAVLSARRQSPKDHFYRLGMGDKDENRVIYTYTDDLSSEHATLFRDVFDDFYHRDQLTSVSIQLTTLDHFCQENSIDRIDFLKVDTEGAEFACLTGARYMLETERITAIQFEFNVLNVNSRVFLRDFYQLLPGYDFFRLDTDRLISIKTYDPMNEIFQFQNILAVSRKHIAQLPPLLSLLP